ncbi:hypothetical protein GALMADRAFT_142776 [Galerina marginata CBS 339.88]|uniref:Uncharacterized protein n=1 Tax=Galerina marginata (strain CBS 339.88) TaxID=685588 RepID=A0A067SSS1_GALM3|nr:hypothetical protein GALMADRAFT_142776 [Galerina marginata CBS 339.88]
MPSKLDISTTGNAMLEEMEMAILNSGEGRPEVSTNDDAVPQTLEAKVSHPKSRSPERRVLLSIGIHEVASTSSSSRQSSKARLPSRPDLNDRVPAIGVNDTDLRPPPPITPVPELPTSWHPKLTPFRLLNLVLPISISTAKAITSLRGNSTAPTTLELISGVVVYLVLFHAGYYESQVKPPHYLRWVFETDCLEYLWQLFEFCSIPRPHYRSTDESDFVVVFTPYHLLVTQTVISFGLTKAVFIAFEYTVAAVWVEWVLAAVLTSCSFNNHISQSLYIAGLYEYGPAEIWPSFYQETEAHRDVALRINGVFIILAVFQSASTLLIGFGGSMIINSLGPALNWEHLTLREREQAYVLEEVISLGPDGGRQFRYGSRPDLYLVMRETILGLLYIFIGSLTVIIVNLGFSDPSRFLRKIVVKIMVHVGGIVMSIVGLVIAGITVHRVWPVEWHGIEVIYLICLISISITGFLFLIGLLVVSVWKTARDIGIGILHLVFPQVFRRMNYAFQEINDLFQDTEPL